VPIVGYKRASLKHAFREPLQAVLKEIFRYLNPVSIYPTYRFTVEDAGLVLQQYNPTTKQYEDVCNLNKVEEEGEDEGLEPVTEEFEYGEDITLGDAVQVINDGGAKVIKASPSDILANDEGLDKKRLECAQVNSTELGTFVEIYNDGDNSDYLTAQAHQINETTGARTSGTKVQIVAQATTTHRIAKLSNNKVVVAHLDGSSHIQAYVIDVNPTTLALTPGSQQTLYNTNSVYRFDIDGDTITGNEFAMMAQYSSGGSNYASWIFSVSGTTVTEEDSDDINTGQSVSYLNVVFLDSARRYAYLYGRQYAGYYTVVTYNGSAQTLGAETEMISGLITYYLKACCIDEDKVALLYQDSHNYAHMKIGEVSGDAIDFTGLEYDVAAEKVDPTGKLAITSLESDDKFAIMYVHNGASSYIRLGTAIGKVITFGQEQPYLVDEFTTGNIVGLDDDYYYWGWSVSTVGYWYLAEGQFFRGTDRTIGLATVTGLSGETHPIALLYGAFDEFTGLTPGDIHYIQNDSSVTTTETNYPIGVATSTTRLFLMRMWTQ
jgi:hypothetical protein